MENKIDNYHFEWEMLGEVNIGRANLGRDVPVVVYRLFELSVREVLTSRYGKEECAEILREAGRVAGHAFTKNALDITLEFNQFVSSLQGVLNELKIGILRIESIEDDGKITLTISEDLDCSGLPVLGEAVCNYDEGFLEGIFQEYSKTAYTAIEVDCWAKGDRVCRFVATPNK